MVITIPSNFSKNATTLLDKNPKKMVLNYTTNPGTNYVASKMDDSAIAKIKAEVSASVTKTYAETIFYFNWNNVRWICWKPAMVLNNYPMV